MKQSRSNACTGSASIVVALQRRDLFLVWQSHGGFLVFVHLLLSKPGSNIWFVALYAGFRAADRICGRRTIYLLTLVSPTSIPSFSSSPWMRGAPQIGFSRLICRISSRISFDTGGRPVWPRRTVQDQNNRNPLRC